MRDRAPLQVVTRDLNVAAHAIATGARLVGTAPAGRGMVRFTLELADGQGDNLAEEFTSSPCCRFMAVRDQLLDRVRSHGGDGDDGKTDQTRRRRSRWRAR